VIPSPIDAGAHIQKRRQKSRRHLVLETAAERPGAGGVHVDRVHVRDEDVDGAPQGYRHSLSVPRIIRHVELLKQDLANPWKRLQDARIGSVNRDRRIVVIEGAGETECGDRGAKAPAEMTQPLDEMRGEPEIVGAQLPVVLAFAKCGIGESLAVGIDELVFLQLLVEGQCVEQDMRMLDP